MTMVRKLEQLTEKKELQNQQNNAKLTNMELALQELWKSACVNQGLGQGGKS